ncbi:hypothetical protein [Spirosoma endophyticum]|uniref:Peptidase U49 n=1 Tax=Spirosoma endophyticum TaxID=662367 RepID=A0A1I1GLM1_9BACT|nr:hypothetical protein [Spirosoma endophyticum]SFC12355.1 hypothetical protein SAMN05216167_101504 [Spirosoma endophyticum]
MTTQDYEVAFDKFIRKETLKKIKREIGRFDTEELDVEKQLFFDAFKNNLQDRINLHQHSRQTAAKGKMPYVHFDLIDSLTFNALAGFDEFGNEFIGVNYGTVLILLDTFNRMMAHEEILPEIGSAYLEESPDRLPKLPTSYVEIESHYDTFDLSSVVLPIDPIREEHAAVLTEFALFFLVEHELCHLRNGHVHYSNSLTSQSFIMEFDSDTDVDLIPLTSKVLEWDADSWASVQGVGFLFQSMRFSPDAYQEIREKYASTEVGLMFNWGFAIWVMFRLIDNVRSENSEFYPIPKIRLHSSIITASGAVKREEGDAHFEEFVSLIRPIFETAETPIGLITNQTIEGFEEINLYFYGKPKPPEIDYLPLYEDHWREVVKPGLLMHSRATDLPD